MIKDGIKKEEYREIKPYYEKRLLDYNGIKLNRENIAFKKYVLGINFDACKEYPRGFEKLIICCGYPKKTDNEKIIEFEKPFIRFGIGKPEWGAEEGKQYFVITWGES